MLKKTIWIWEAKPTSCSACQAMAGEYKVKPEKQPPLHPNCNCKLYEKEIENNELQLNSTVASNSSMNLEDVKNIKERLLKTGDYKVDSRTGETLNNLYFYPNRNLIDGIRSFQKRNSLKIDGIIRPTGKTIQKLKNQTDENSKDNKVISEGFLSKLKEHEGIVKHGYVDTKGNITIGIGKLVNTKKAFIDLSLKKINGTLASKEEKNKEYERIRQIQKEKNATGSNNFTSRSYRSKAQLELSKKEIFKQMNDHINYNINLLKNKLSKNNIDYDRLPTKAKQGLIEMQYNMGNKLNINKWKKFFIAIKNGNWDKASKESHGVDINKERNIWRADMFKNAKYQ